MATHSSNLVWKITWMEEPGRLQSMGSLGVGHNLETSLSRIGEGNGNPLQCSCLENPKDSGAWWAAVYGVAQSRTRLKRLSSSSNLEAHNLSNILCLSGLSVQWDRGQFKLTQVNQGNLLAQVTRKESISFRHSLI